MGEFLRTLLRGVGALASSHVVAAWVLPSILSIHVGWFGCWFFPFALINFLLILITSMSFLALFRRPKNSCEENNFDSSWRWGRKNTQQRTSQWTRPCKYQIPKSGHPFHTYGKRRWSWFWKCRFHTYPPRQAVCCYSRKGWLGVLLFRG